MDNDSYNHCLATWRKYFDFFLSVFTFIVCLSVLVFVIYSYVGNNGGIQGTQDAAVDDLMCLNCEMLDKVLDFSEMDSLKHIHNENGIEMCCASDLIQLSGLWERDWKHSKAENKNPTHLPVARNNTLSLAFAHKKLLPPKSSLQNKDMLPYFESGRNVRLQLNASHNNLPHEKSENVEVLPTGLRILQSGLYQVYSNIHFKTDNSRPCSAYPLKTWYHSIVRSSQNNAQRSGTILQSVHTCCDNCTHDQETSYTAGVFELWTGDHLHIEVSEHGVVSFQRESSYLGLIMLGTEKKI